MLRQGGASGLFPLGRARRSEFEAAFVVLVRMVLVGGCRSAGVYFVVEGGSEVLSWACLSRLDLVCQLGDSLEYLSALAGLRIRRGGTR